MKIRWIWERIRRTGSVTGRKAAERTDSPESLSNAALSKFPSLPSVCRTRRRSVDEMARFFVSISTMVTRRFWRPCAGVGFSRGSEHDNEIPLLLLETWPAESDLPEPLLLLGALSIPLSIFGRSDRCLLLRLGVPVSLVGSLLPLCDTRFFAKTPVVEFEEEFSEEDGSLKKVH